MRAVGEGIAQLAARRADGSVVAQRAITVARIAVVGFAFLPAGDQPLARLAALPGARERLQVLPRSRDGATLGGADKLIELELTGDLELIDRATAQARPGELNILFAAVRPGYEIGVRFGALGAGSITATIDGVSLGSIAIEVIAAAREVGLRWSQPLAQIGASIAAPQGSVLVLDLVGSDGGGAPVAGIVGDFAAAPPELVTILPFFAGTPSLLGIGEVLVQPRATGSVTIEARLADRTLSTQLQIQPLM
jgi:hypothetical protein